MGLRLVLCSALECIARQLAAYLVATGCKTALLALLIKTQFNTIVHCCEHVSFSKVKFGWGW